jgi:beta-lactamase regulating signal transducer with metallopeptidase domain
MPQIIMYLLKFSASLAVVYLFYQFVLRRLTFYNANRWYLLGYCLLSFLIPFINVEQIVETKTFNGMQVINFIPVIENNVLINKNYLSQPANNFTLNYWHILLTILAIGSLIMIVRLLIQFLSLQKIKRKAIVMNDGGTNIYQVNENIIPFSFGNAIYVNQHLHSEKEMEDIILHEYVHVRQKHTIDILLAEFICIINWYNPFAWLIRYAIRQNLEFIADNDVLKKGLDKKSYQYHLLKVVGILQYRIANSFNFSSLKKRIAMMNKLKSAKLHLVKFLFILPLIAVLLVAFRDKYEGIFKNHNATIINEVGIIIDLSAKQPIAGVSVLDSISGVSSITDKNGFYSLKIPVKKDTAEIHIQFEKDGYEKNFIGHTFPVSKLNSHGFIDIVPMLSLNKSATGVFIGPMGNKFPDEPTYEDALKQLQSSYNINDDISNYLKLEKDHPEVSLFYSSEYKTHQIVIYKNGDVEKYGYPNGPTINDMEKKFGHLPDMMTKSNSPIPAEYLNKWESIAANAEKNFHTTNPDVYAIIFPGDSRVVAVPKNEKAKMYDMDNGAPEERRLFEKLYGSLTGIVPAPAGSFSMFNYDEKYKDWNIDGIQFPGFSSVVINREYSATHFVGSGMLKINPSIAKGLIIYNNKEYNAASFYKQFGNSDRKFNDVFIYENKSAFDKFGDKARNGVVVIGGDGKKGTADVNDNNNPIESATINNKPVTSISLHRNDKMDDTHKDFFNRNPSVQLLHWKLNNNELDIYLSENKIEKYDLTKDLQKAIAKYGKIPLPVAGSYGTAEIVQPDKTDTVPANADASLNGPSYVSPLYVIKPLQKQNPLYIVDGRELPSEKNLDSIINPNLIESVSILKGTDATELYGDKGKNGAIIIKTKKEINQVKTFPVILKADTIEYNKSGLHFSGTVTINDDKTSIVNGNISFDYKNGSLPLIIYNGNQINHIKNFKTFNGSYKLVSLNQKEALQKYGYKGAEGAVEISTL